MANVHIGSFDKQSGKFRLLVHVPVPDETLGSGVGFREALRRSGLNESAMKVGPMDAPGTISDAENALIQNGSLYESDEQQELANSTPEALSAAAQAWYDENEADIIEDVREQLEWFGVEAQPEE